MCVDIGAAKSLAALLKVNENNDREWSL